MLGYLLLGQQGHPPFLCGNLVAWRITYSVVVRSSAERGFRAMTQEIYKLLCMKIVLEDTI